MSNPQEKPFVSRGFVCVLAGCLLIFCIVVHIVVVGRPAFVLGRSTSAANACPNNLRQIDAAAQQFALEHHLTNGAPINFPDDLMPYVKLNSAGKVPGCPAGGIYSIKRVGDTPVCSLGTTVTPAHVLP
jgi:hypothetical protein